MGSSSRTKVEIVKSDDGAKYKRTKTTVEDGRRCCLITTCCIFGLWPCVACILFSNYGISKYQTLDAIDQKPADVSGTPDLSTLKIDRS